jgi:hypothetical protein
MYAGNAGLTALREGWKPVWAKNMASGRRLDAQRDSLTLRIEARPESSGATKYVQIPRSLTSWSLHARAPRNSLTVGDSF